jgi:hypothetical protein
MQIPDVPTASLDQVQALALICLYLQLGGPSFTEPRPSGLCRGRTTRPGTAEMS